MAARVPYKKDASLEEIFPSDVENDYIELPLIDHSTLTMDVGEVNVPLVSRLSPTKSTPPLRPLVWEEMRIDTMSEIAFLRMLQHETDSNKLLNHVQMRLDHLIVNDDALKMNRMPVWKLSLMRSPAILLTLSLEIMVGVIIAQYKDLLEKNLLLASFMPVLSSVSGNIGLQASTTTLRALALGHYKHDSLTDISKIFIKEFFSALLVALVAGGILGVIAGVWDQSYKFGLTTGLSILFSASVAGVIGGLSPLFFKNLKIDPAVSAGPFETAIQDMIGISVYLSLGLLLL